MGPLSRGYIFQPLLLSVVAMWLWSFWTNGTWTEGFVWNFLKEMACPSSSPPPSHRLGRACVVVRQLLPNRWGQHPGWFNGGVMRQKVLGPRITGWGRDTCHLDFLPVSVLWEKNEPSACSNRCILLSLCYSKLAYILRNTGHLSRPQFIFL